MENFTEGTVLVLYPLLPHLCILDQTIIFQSFDSNKLNLIYVFPKFDLLVVCTIERKARHFSKKWKWLQWYVFLFPSIFLPNQFSKKHLFFWDEKDAFEDICIDNFSKKCFWKFWLSQKKLWMIWMWRNVYNLKIERLNY